MPIGSQPRGARGTVGHPYSALNLRLVLATFGLITCVVLGVILLWWDLSGWGAAVLAVLALIAAADLGVIQMRRRRRREEDPTSHSLFE